MRWKERLSEVWLDWFSSEQFLADESPGMKQAKVGNQLIKVDPATNRVLAGHAMERFFRFI